MPRLICILLDIISNNADITNVLLEMFKNLKIVTQSSKIVISYNSGFYDILKKLKNLYDTIQNNILSIISYNVNSTITKAFKNSLKATLEASNKIESLLKIVNTNDVTLIKDNLTTFTDTIYSIYNAENIIKTSISELINYSQKIFTKDLGSLKNFIYVNGYFDNISYYINKSIIDYINISYCSESDITNCEYIKNIKINNINLIDFLENSTDNIINSINLQDYIKEVNILIKDLNSVNYTINSSNIDTFLASLTTLIQNMILLEYNSKVIVKNYISQLTHNNNFSC